MVYLTYFWTTLEKKLVIFIPTFGHTCGGSNATSLSNSTFLLLAVFMKYRDLSKGLENPVTKVSNSVNLLAERSTRLI